jgi:hypothetical protein
MGKEKADDKGKEGVHWFIKRMVAVFATFFVVIGVALIGLLARDTMPDVPVETLPATSTAVYEPGFLFVDGGSTSLHKMSGELVRVLRWPEDTSIFNKPVSQLTGVDIMSGGTVWLDNGFTISTSTKFRSPDGRREAGLEERRRDGSTPLVIMYGNDKDVRVLRSSENKLIKDIGLIGWVSDKRFVFTGNATGSEVVFVLDLGGGVSYVAPTLENAWKYMVFDKDIYVSTSGIVNADGQEARVAPSSLYKIGLTGGREELLHIEDSVVQAFAVNGKAIAYALADQNMYKKTGDAEFDLGECIPLMLLPGDEVVCRFGDSIEIRTESEDPFKLIEANNSALFYLEKVRMDERAQNE